MDKNNKKPNKYALDSSATFYPYLTTKKAQSMFCVGAVLDDDIDKELLGRALNDAVLRFPLYKTQLKKGYGAYYLLENSKPLNVFDWDGRVLSPIDTKRTNGYQFRLSYDGRRVMLEVFHALTDANGAIKFLAAILRRYRELQGVEFPSDCAVDAWDSPVPDSELEDGFKKNYKHIPFSALNLKGMAGGVPHRVKGTLLKDGYKLEEGLCAASQIVAKAKEMGVSVTAYIAGIVGYGILSCANIKKPVAIMVPVNLRKIFGSDTASNFVTFVRLILKKQECKSLEDCVKTCAKQLQNKASKPRMQAFMCTTVRAQRNIIFRCVPLFLKWIFIRLGRVFMKSRQTIIVSNVGCVAMPKELGLEALTLILNVSKNNVQNLGITTYGDDCRMIFTSAIAEPIVPNAVFGAFENEGIKATKTEIIRNI